MYIIVDASTNNSEGYLFSSIPNERTTPYMKPEIRNKNQKKSQDSFKIVKVTQTTKIANPQNKEFFIFFYMAICLVIQN